MSFLNPLGLLGLISVPVIIGLHMHRERSRRVIVSSLNLWSFLDVQLRGSKPRQIRITWLLFLDLMIAALLSLALAQPRVNMPTGFDPSEHFIILLDDSSSMLATDVTPTRFDQAKLGVQDLLDELNPRDFVSILTFGGKVITVGDSREFSLQELSNKIANLQAGDNGVAIHSAISVGDSLAIETIPVQYHVYTDGAYEMPTLSNIPDSVQWHFYGEKSGNQAITSLSVAEVNSSSHQLLANIANFSNDHINREVVLQVDNIEVSKTLVELIPQTLISQIWNIAGEPQVISVSLSGKDTLPQDDFASLGKNYGRTIHIALVSDNPYPVDRAIQSVPNVELDIYQPADFLVGMDFDLVVFRGNLPTSWPIGNVLVLDPPLDSDLLNVIGIVPISNQPSYEEIDLLEGVDFNGVRWGSAWELEDAENIFTPVLSSGEKPLILTGRINLSDIGVFLPVLDEGNLTKHPFFPIFISNVISSSHGVTFPTQVEVGAEIQLPPPDKYPSVKVINPLGDMNEFPHIDWRTYKDTKMPGAYQLEITDVHGNNEIYSIGVNAGSLLESKLTTGDWVTDVQTAVERGNGQLTHDLDISPWLLGIALAFVFLEAVRAWR
jgi:hypothetical protein